MGQHQSIDAKILLIGAGKMGSALLGAWLHAGLAPERITVVEVNPVSLPDGVKVLPALNAVSETFDCIVLAVKPQAMDAVAKELSQSRVFLSLRERLGEGQHGKSSPLTPHPSPLPEGEGILSAGPLFLSIAAGKTLTYFKKHLPETAVVRAMPNTPALIRKGITALVANDKVSAAQKKLADSLLQAAGETLWLNDESKMDAVTALSGSGPAYVFLFLEALIAAGVAQGLSEDVAKKLALQTLRGSVKLAMKSEEPLAALRKNVTSPGGTTEAALAVLMKDDALQKLMDEAVKAAVRRAKELDNV